jgi:hypothetical protein
MYQIKLLDEKRNVIRSMALRRSEGLFVAAAEAAAQVGQDGVDGYEIYLEDVLVLKHPFES